MRYRLCATIGVLLLCLAAPACNDDGGDPGTGGSGGSTSGTGGSTGGSGGGSTGGGGAGGSCEQGGPVELNGVANARGICGLTTADGAEVKPLVLIRSGHLGDLDATGCGQLQALQIQSVVDLRPADTVASTPDADCVLSSVAYHGAPLTGLPPSEAAYLQMLAEAEPELLGIFTHLADNGLPAIIHCVSGRDRANLIMALLLRALGVPEAQVLNDFTVNQDTGIELQAAWLQAVFDEIELAGGMEAYLAGHGVTSTQLDTLKSLALAP